MSTEKKWYVSLGDGTFVEMGVNPYVFLATQEQIDKMDETGDAPIDCTDEADGAFESHIHIQDLVLYSHWDDHTPVVDRSTPDRINS